MSPAAAAINNNQHHSSNLEKSLIGRVTSRYGGIRCLPLTLIISPGLSLDTISIGFCSSSRTGIDQSELENTETRPWQLQQRRSNGPPIRVLRSALRHERLGSIIHRIGSPLRRRALQRRHRSRLARFPRLSTLTMWSALWRRPPSRCARSPRRSFRPCPSASSRLRSRRAR